MRKLMISFVAILVQVFFAGALGAQQLKLGELELIYTEDELPIRYDGSLSTLKWDGAMHFFHSFGCRLKSSMTRRSRHSWHRGTPLDPLKIHVSSQTDKKLWDYNGYYEDIEEKGIWILGIYQCANGDLLAITHAELNDANEAGVIDRSEQRFAMGLGYSNDRGASWTYCGEIVRPADDRQNIGGGAYIVRDGYLHVYFNDVVPGIDGRRKQRLQSVARAKLSEVVGAAKRHRVTTWHKYQAGEWGTPGLSGKPGQDIIPHINGREDLHSDAAYCTALQKYLLTVQGGGELFLFSSIDGVDWELEVTVDEVGRERVIQPYSTFVDFEGPSADCHVVDGDFYLYFPRKGPDHEYDILYRRRVTVE